MTLFNIKYAPTKAEQVTGQQLATAQLKEFVLNYSKQNHKAALLYGPIGTGKTCSVYALAKELKYDLLEFNSSNLRNEAEMSSFLNASLGQRSLFFTPKLILIDEIDNVSGVYDRGAIPTLCKQIETSQFPVILTANDIEESKLKPLRKASLLIEFPKIAAKTIADHLRFISLEEKIPFDDTALQSLARHSDGDMRAALIDLQILAAHGNISSDSVRGLSDRKRSESIINALRIIFKASMAQNALAAFENVDMDPKELFLWIDENLPKEYLDPASLAKAYEHLSRAEIFNARITHLQHWRFLSYVFDLITAGIASAKSQKNHNALEYRATMRLLRIWQTNIKNAQRKQIAKKIAAKTHISQKRAFQQALAYKTMFSAKQMEQVVEELGLSDEEEEWLIK